MWETPRSEARLEDNRSDRGVGLREVYELPSRGVRKRIELECLHGRGDFERGHSLPYTSATDGALAPFALTLRSAGSGKRGVPCPAYFCAT